MILVASLNPGHHFGNLWNIVIRLDKNIMLKLINSKIEILNHSAIYLKLDHLH